MFEKFDKKSHTYPIVGNSKGYRINQHGVVLTEEFNPVPCALNSDGEPVVEIEFLGEHGSHRVIDLVACHFKWLLVQYKLLRNIVGFPIDGDPTNTHASNVAYRLKEFPLEHPNYEGFYYVPGYPRVLISKKGVVKKEESGRVIKMHVTKPSKNNPKNITHGYYVISYTAGGSRFTFGRHRAMLLAFKPIPSNVEKLVTNHKDGIPGNDGIDNLEWVTRKENLSHAYRENLRQQNREVLVKNILTDEVTKHYSVEAAARATGVSGSLFNLMLEKYDFGHVNQKGYMIKYLTDKRDWVIYEDPQTVVESKQQAIPVKSRNCLTGEVEVHDSIASAGKVTGVNYNTIGYRLSKQDYSPLVGFQFIPEEVEEFPDFTKEQYENSLKPTKFKVNARNFLTGEKMDFDSIYSAEKTHGHSCIASAFRKGLQPKFSDGWTYKYPDEVWDEIEDPEELAASLTSTISAKNIKSGETHTALNFAAMGRLLGLDPKMISRLVQEGSSVPYHDWLFIKGDNLDDFPEPTYPPKPYIVIKDGVEYECDIHEAVNFTGFAKSTLNRKAREGKNNLSDSIIFKYNT